MFDLPKYGDGVCLARLAELLNELGIRRVWLQRSSVVVTGSNGKGSTAAMCAAIGHAYGLRTGLFTSPHLLRFNERIRIDGVEIGDDAFARCKQKVEAAIAGISQQRGEKFGAFEALFALACLHFEESRCEFIVFEAGIGGRYDPVRLVGARQTCVTSVDYEHVELLGNTLELIASDKSDACANGGTIVYGENCRGLRQHLTEYNRHRGITSLFVRDEIGIYGEQASASGQRFDYQFGNPHYRRSGTRVLDLVPVHHDYRGLETRLLGTAQFNNAAIAATLFLFWLERSRPHKAPERIEAALRAGLRETQWPGRLEVITQDPLTVIDVGHTPDGIRQSLASLKAIHGDQNWILVTGASSDKKAGEIVGALAPSFDTIVATAAYHKGANPHDIAAAARLANPGAEIHVAATIEDAVRLADALAASPKRKLYVAGGLFLAIEYATAARGGRAQDLKFF
ncbi:bifunctional folylpolyglutamate synthase/dihydrofolate synthase [Bradyrhizobium sp. LjRoot220]|uniref:bifunctional folylpolyglutamate synthase/dihydrofolate synthase n=1 Tax=Bradyrhizobium sp. LjRoot220 TaxID=3342284 RepID=UPI003ED13369